MQHTIGFRVPYVFVIMELASRKLIHFNVTEHPTLDWTKQQVRNACFEEQPKFLLHDKDGKFGHLGHPQGVDRAGKTISRRSTFDAWLWQVMGIRGIFIPYGVPGFSGSRVFLRQAVIGFPCIFKSEHRLRLSFPQQEKGAPSGRPAPGPEGVRKEALQYQNGREMGNPKNPPKVRPLADCRLQGEPH